MATATGTQIVASVRFLSQDEDASSYRNTDTEMLTWLNDALIALCRLVPMESIRTANITLADGALQVIPAEAIALLSVNRNFGVSGASPGDAITPTSSELLDVFIPSWQSGARVTSIVHYIPDAVDPKKFRVYPPASSGIQVEATYSTTPARMTSLTGTIPVNDTYAPALVNYVLYRLYSKDVDEAANAQIAGAYFAAFQAAAGVAA